MWIVLFALSATIYDALRSGTFRFSLLALRVGSRSEIVVRQDWIRSISVSRIVIVFLFLFVRLQFCLVRLWPVSPWRTGKRLSSQYQPKTYYIR